MPVPNINLNCSVLVFKYGAGGVISGSYLNCGDYTPITFSATGGVSGNVYSIVKGVSASVSMTTGTFELSSATVGGWTDRYKTWTQFVKTSGY